MLRVILLYSVDLTEETVHFSLLLGLTAVEIVG
jgi:hypothetical protein